MSQVEVTATKISYFLPFSNEHLSDFLAVGEMLEYGLSSVDERARIRRRWLARGDHPELGWYQAKDDWVEGLRQR